MNIPRLPLLLLRGKPYYGPYSRSQGDRKNPELALRGANGERFVGMHFEVDTKGVVLSRSNVRKDGSVEEGDWMDCVTLLQSHEEYLERRNRRYTNFKLFRRIGREVSVGD